MSPAGVNVSSQLHQVYCRLLDHYGPQNWWPADTPFEVMVGAILTQNTAWRNVELAIQNLRQADLLTAERILACPDGELAQLLRPAGYFNIKTSRLKNLCRFLEGVSYPQLASIPTAELREQFLSVKGVGPETADDILLYAFRRPVFVIDAYTRRIFSRLGLVSGAESYEQLRARFEKELVSSEAVYGEYHALIIQHAKAACRVRPECDSCALASQCEYSNK